MTGKFRDRIRPRLEIFSYNWEGEWLRNLKNISKFQVTWILEQSISEMYSWIERRWEYLLTIHVIHKMKERRHSSWIRRYSHLLSIHEYTSDMLCSRIQVTRNFLNHSPSQLYIKKILAVGGCEPTAFCVWDGHTTTAPGSLVAWRSKYALYKTT